MIAASFSDWAAAACAALSLGAVVAIPYLLWVNADYWLVADWQPVRDRVLVETVNVRHTAREARRHAAAAVVALLLFLSSSREVTR